MSEQPSNRAQWTVIHESPVPWQDSLIDAIARLRSATALATAAHAAEWAASEALDKARDGSLRCRQEETDARKHLLLVVAGDLVALRQG